MISGLVIAGRIVEMPGTRIIPPASYEGPGWARLDPGDYRARRTTWVRQIILHTTGGLWPQPIIPGAGPRGHAEQIATMWSGADRSGGERVHSAAQLIVDFDGAIACLCDLVTTAAYHAEASNDYSVGIEMSTLPDGGIYQATLDATVELVPVLCAEFGIPFQIHAAPYHNEPLLRMEIPAAGGRTQLGGARCVGVFGHRDNTSERGRGDPGDAIYAALIAAGAEPLDYAIGQDLVRGRLRQIWLNAEQSRRGETWAPLVVDGLVGPASLARARQMGVVPWSKVPLA